MLLIEKLAYSSKFRNVSPFLKGLLSIAGIFVLLSVQHPAFFITVFLGIPILLVGFGNVPLKSYLKLLRLPTVFILMGVVSIAVDIYPKDPLVSFYAVGISKAGLQTASLLFMRAFSCFSLLLFLTTTTPINAMIASMNRLHVPKSMIEIFMLIYRSIFLFLSETQVIYEAQRNRGGYSTFKNSLHSSSLLMKSLVISLFQKEKETDQYLAARGFQGEFYIEGGKR